MERFIRALSGFLAVLSSVAIVIMVVAIASDVIVRNSTGASLPGMVEVAETSLVASVFFGLAWAGVQGEHVAVTLVTDRFSQSWARVTNIFVWTITSAFVAWLLYASTARAIDSTRMLEERFGIVRWPMYPMRWVLVIGFTALLLVTLTNLARTLAGHAPMGRTSELGAVLEQDQDDPSQAGGVRLPSATAPDYIQRDTRTMNPGGRDT